MSSLGPWRGQRGGSAGAHPLAQFRDDLNSLFEQFFGGSSLTGPEREGLRLWDFDVAEGNNEITVRAEMPGFEPGDINIQVDNDVLTIQAESRQQGEQQRSYRRFRRSVTLPAGVDADRASATYRNGVLELHIPRTAAGRAKRITVQGQAAGAGQRQQAAGQAQQPSAQQGGQEAVGTQAGSASRKAK
jgi:HSP20 family protein